ncbi:MAG: hypothetical protein DCF19_22895 [Pseudanabaena frigida]|uniref:Glycosyl transferase family 1 domain-containing protein n=1 Tax=Pseudanabaena frigida TaxID=945775 RepID=A0A2W4VU48_9CYAN|nr:MAG: hypothetical protein DCF19_22895 [Pseudanabaena frigida]
MKIFLDCTHTAKHTYKNTGIHRVVRELETELLNITSSNNDIEVVAVMFEGNAMRRVNNLYQQDSGNNLVNNRYPLIVVKVIRKSKFIFSKIVNKLTSLFSGISLEWLSLSFDSNNKPINFENYQVMKGDIYVIADANWDLPLSYYNFLQRLRRQGVVITTICYDLIPIKFPEFVPKTFADVFMAFYRDYSNLFDKVLCISQNTVEDYKNAQREGILDNSNPNLIVTKFKLGCDYSNYESLSKVEEESFDKDRELLLSKRYILVVGSLSPHKNIKAIVEAFDLLVKSGQEDVYLLFAGNRGWHRETDMLIESNKMYGKLVHTLGSVTDSELKILYQKCYCLVQASFYEGFGLPVVEALQCNKPVIASNGGSLPEVGEGFCLYFDPTQSEQLYQALKKLTDSDVYYNQLVDNIKNNYRPFSWKDSAEQFLANLL